MPKLRSFNSIRDLSFTNLLVTAFQAVPKKVREVQEREGWNSFSDFMAAVERSGRVLYQFGEKPSGEIVDEQVLRPFYDKANAEALHKLLSLAFFGPQNGDPDSELSKEALGRLGIENWNDFSLAILSISDEVYRDLNKSIPLDEASPETLLLLGLIESPTVEAMNKVMKDFGLPSQEHLRALVRVIGDLTIEDLNRAVGNPELLTELVNRSPSNLSKKIVFSHVDNPLGLGYSGSYL